MTVGIGYDLHRLVPDRRLVLAGVQIPYPLGLLGHSDADVLTHAIIDALLGAATLGDIGQHFPDSDPQFSGADSLVLLGAVGQLLGATGWQVINIDATVIMERPKLAPHLPSVRQRLAEVLGLQLTQISVKAKTNEGMGYLGAGEAVAALAVAQLVPTAGVNCGV